MGRDSNTIDDLLQETFFRAWRHRKKFLDEGKDRPYLLKIADRLLVDEFRKRRWKTQPLEGDVFSRNDESDHRMLDMENREMLRKAMGLLSEPQQRTLLLRFYGQMSFQDIAQHLGCPLSTALSHCRRGLESLRQLLVSVDP
jgi:RNA polymerase sigma-70 factor (ECF subfamily)